MLSTTEAAEILGVSAETIRRWAADGKIQAVRLPGGQLRIQRTEIDAILTGGSAA